MSKKQVLLNDPDVMLIRTKEPEQLDFASVVYNFTNNKVWNKVVPFEGFSALELGDNHYALYKDSGSTWKDVQGNPVVRDKQYFDDMRGSSLIKKFTGKGRTPDLVVKVTGKQFTESHTNWKNYWEWKNKRNVTRSALEEQFGYDCYTDDTEFLTNTGWKHFDDVLDTDNLATFNPLSQKLEYQPPIERIESLYTGNLYHLNGYHVDSLVTANHHMYVRPYSRTTQTKGNWGFERAGELSETFDTLNIIKPKINRQLLPKECNIQLFDHVCMLDYMRLIGWYVSDGTMQFDSLGNVKCMVITQSKPQSKLTQTLTKQIKYGKIQCKEYEYEPRGLSKYSERRWTFNQELSQLILNDCGHKSEHKRLPSWCFFLTKREMATLLVSLLQGDGTKKNHQNHTYVYYTINPLLANDVQRLAFLCGFETSLYGPYKIDSTFETQNSMYHVHINMRPTLTRRHTRSASVTKIPVSNQRIVCFMVKNYTLVTRRNGQIGLHGNTKHAMHLVRLLRMGHEALTEGVIKVRRPDAQELLSIRGGAWTYEEVVEYAEFMNAEVDKAVKTTNLNKDVNLKQVTRLILDIQDTVW